MSEQGYYRFPALHGDTIAFVSEDDLWSVPVTGGCARRLTANLGANSVPAFSPDGKWLAFTGREEGQADVYVMASEGGPLKRLTYEGGATVLGWQDDKILHTTAAGQPFRSLAMAYSIGMEGGLSSPLSIGPIVSITIASGGRMAVGRNNNDPARWKRYKGGTAGDIWIDAEGSGLFKRLITLNGNLARPMWIGERIYFLSDHEGIGNLYSCLPTGEDLQRQTTHTDYYARFPYSDGDCGFGVG